MKILKAWIAPFPTGTGAKSGMSTIALRVPIVECERFPLRLERHLNIHHAIKNHEGHFNIGLFDDDTLFILKEAIEEYLKEENIKR